MVLNLCSGTKCMYLELPWPDTAVVLNLGGFTSSCTRVQLYNFFPICSETRHKL
jgi:hypothetical protein